MHEESKSSLGQDLSLSRQDLSINPLKPPKQGARRPRPLRSKLFALNDSGYDGEADEDNEDYVETSRDFDERSRRIGTDKEFEDKLGSLKIDDGRRREDPRSLFSSIKASYARGSESNDFEAYLDMKAQYESKILNPIVSGHPSEPESEDDHDDGKDEEERSMNLGADVVSEGQAPKTSLLDDDYDSSEDEEHIVVEPRLLECNILLGEPTGKCAKAPTSPSRADGLPSNPSCSSSNPVGSNPVGSKPMGSKSKSRKRRGMGDRAMEASVVKTVVGSTEHKVSEDEAKRHNLTGAIAASELNTNFNHVARSRHHIDWLAQNARENEERVAHDAEQAKRAHKNARLRYGW